MRITDDENMCPEDSFLREEVVGLRLTAVWFVHSYVQLWFDYTSITLLTSPSVDNNGVRLGWSDYGHRDVLCQQIEHIVISTSISPKKSLELVFDTDIRLIASLEEKDSVGPEAVIFQAEDKNWWVI